jgi:hydroxymethylpyrimidine pyrophosphatase-like HAD family hydrolase
MPIIDGLDFPFYICPSSGSRIHSPQKKLLFSFDIDRESIKSILDLGIDLEIATVLLEENVVQTNKNKEKLNSF